MSFNSVKDVFLATLNLCSGVIMKTETDFSPASVRVSLPIHMHEAS